MPVQTIECQLTQAQMKRYLAGADFPEAIVAALERHLKACPECMEEANKQRLALGGAPVEIAHAVVEESAPKGLAGKAKGLFQRSAAKPVEAQPLIAAPGDSADTVSTLSFLKTPKNLVLSGSLAIVLVLMSTVLRNPTNLFGPRATAALSTPPATSASSTADSSEAKDPAQDTEKTSADEGTKAPEPETASASPDTSSKPAEPEMKAVTEKPATEATEKPTEPVADKPASKTLEKVGGNVIVADSAKPATSHRAVARAKARPTVRKPRARKPFRVVRAAKPKAPVNRIRVYKS